MRCRRSIPTGSRSAAELRATTRRALQAAQPADANDRVTVAALDDEFDVAVALRALGEEESDLNNVASPVQSLRDVFDLMPTETVDQWAIGARRLAALPASVDGYIASLRYAADRGHVRGTPPGRGRR